MFILNSYFSLSKVSENFINLSNSSNLNTNGDILANTSLTFDTQSSIFTSTGIGKFDFVLESGFLNSSYSIFLNFKYIEGSLALFLIPSFYIKNDGVYTTSVKILNYDFTLLTDFTPILFIFNSTLSTFFVRIGNDSFLLTDLPNNSTSGLYGLFSNSSTSSFSFSYFQIFDRLLDESEIKLLFGEINLNDIFLKLLEIQSNSNQIDLSILAKSSELATLQTNLYQKIDDKTIPIDTSNLAKSSELATLQTNLYQKIDDKTIPIDTFNLAKSSELATLQTNLYQKIDDKTIPIDETAISNAVSTAIADANFNVTAETINLGSVTLPTLSMVDIGGQFGSRFAKDELVDYRYLDSKGNVVSVLLGCKVLWCIVATRAIGSFTFLYGLEFVDSSTGITKTLNAFEELLSKHIPQA